MGQTVLVRGLLDGAGIGGQIEFGTLRGFAVIPYVISKAIVQITDADGRVLRKGRQFLFVLRPETESEQERKEEEDCFFHMNRKRI